MEAYLNDVSVGLATLLPIVNPVAAASVFATMTSDMAAAQRRRQINLIALYVFIGLLVCFYAGRTIMGVFGMALPGVRVAGGLIVCYMGFDMLFPARGGATVPAQTEARKKMEMASIAFVPMTLPVTIGPGVIAVVLSNASVFGASMHRWQDHLAVITADIGIAAVVWITLRCAGPLLARCGPGGIQGLSRLVGFILICIGVQYALHGLIDTFRI